MDFELVFDKKAVKALQRLPLEIRRRIFSKLVEAKKDPYRFFERLSGRLDYKLRVGAYRVIADLRQDHERIQITKAGHRKHTYER